MAKCTITYLVSMKCGDSNHYNSNCLLCQRCWLLCTTYGECKAARTCEDNVGHRQDFFYSTHRTAMSAKI
jgi:hypothetical protein